MSDYFVFNGVSSKDYGVVFDLQTDNASSWQYSTVQIPGRNGDLVYSNNRFPNVDHMYSLVVYDDFETNYMNMRNKLLAPKGYCRLEDSIHADEYYMAVINGDIEPVIITDRSIGKCEVAFTRKPQRYLKSGETVKQFTASGAITNPTLFTAKPLLRIYGVGTLQIGDGAIAISYADTYTDIDCETMEAYKGTFSCNGRVSVSGYDFPQLTPGENGVILGAGITRVDVTPRWWRI